MKVLKDLYDTGKVCTHAAEHCSDNFGINTISVGVAEFTKLV